MKVDRTKAIGLLVAVFGLFAAASVGAQGQDKLLRIVVPFGPGGGSDTIARIIQPKLAEALKQTVLIDNRPGAGGTIGAAQVATAPPDGSVVLLSDASVVTISPALFGKQIPYTASDLVPVINLAKFANVLVAAPGFPVNSVPELISQDKASPGKFTIASSGNGATPHLTAELLKSVTGLQLVHVPYKGSGPAISDTVAGHVNMVFTGYATVAGMFKAGKLKALAVTSPLRIAELPNVPTVAEAGYPGFEAWIAQAVFAPHGTPPDVARRLNQAIAAVLRQPDVLEKLRQQGLEPHDNTPEEFAAFVRQQATQWSKVIREANVKPD